MNIPERKVTLIDDTYECNICFGKMAYKDGILIVAGGTGSASRNYSFDMNKK